jgi:hypothetical protein
MERCVPSDGEAVAFELHVLKDDFIAPRDDGGPSSHGAELRGALTGELEHVHACEVEVPRPEISVAWSSRLFGCDEYLPCSNSTREQAISTLVQTTATP